MEVKEILKILTITLLLAIILIIICSLFIFLGIKFISKLFVDSATTIYEVRFDEKTTILEEDIINITKILDFETIPQSINIVRIGYQQPYMHETNYYIEFSIDSKESENLLFNNKNIYLVEKKQNEDLTIVKCNISADTNISENFKYIKNLVNKYI